MEGAGKGERWEGEVKGEGKGLSTAVVTGGFHAHLGGVWIVWTGGITGRI